MESNFNTDVLSDEIRENDIEKAFISIDKLFTNSNFYKNVFLAVILERKEIFEYILKKNINLNITNDSGISLLQQCTRCSDEFFIQKVLDTGIDLQQKMYKNILHFLVRLDNPRFVQIFLEYGVPMNREDVMGMTPLDIAVEENNFEIVSMLLYYNCDTVPKCGNISSFRYSMICDIDVEIKLLLLEYETEINNEDLMMNNLFIAIEKCNELIIPLLEHGADANILRHDRNIIEFILDHPIQPNLFQAIWHKFDYETWKSTIDECILLVILTNDTIPTELWNGYIKIIIESSKISHILEQNTPSLISVLVEEYVRHFFKESDFYHLICILLMNGCSVYAINLHKVYNLLGGESQTLKLLIHMDVERGHLNIDFNFVRIKYNFNTSVSQLLQNFLFNMKVFNMSPSYRDILRYFTVPPDVKEYLQNYNTLRCPFQIIWNRTVPSLVELSRNKTRDFICKMYKIKSGSQFYSIVKHSALPKIIKDIITFERPLYLDV